MPATIGNRALALLGAGLIAACGGDPISPPPPPPGPPAASISVSADPVSVEQGGVGTATVTVGRTNTTGAIELTVEGLPTGVTATFDPETVANPGTTSTLRLEAEAGVRVRSHDLTIRARTAGVEDATVAVVLTVTADPAITSGRLTLDAPVADFVYDPKRNVVFLAQPALSQIGVLSLASLSFRSPISTAPEGPTGLDLSAGGDSLIVSLPGAQALGIVRLNLSDAVRDTIRLTTGSSDLRPDQVRAMANGLLFVGLTFTGNGLGGTLLEYDLESQTQATRLDVGVAGVLSEATTLARSTDRERLVLVVGNICCPVSAQWYDAETDSWSDPVNTVSQSLPTVSANHDGSRFLIGATVFSGSLDLVQAYTPTGYSSGPTALGTDDATMFVGVGSDVVQIRLSTGGTVDTFGASQEVKRILALPDAKGLVVFTEGEVRVFAFEP